MVATVTQIIQKNPRVLIVDDDEAITDVLSEILKDTYHVTTASSAKQAFYLIKQFSYDVILLDIMLEDDSGIEVLKYIKSQPSSTEVIMITAVKDIRTVIQTMKLGAYDYITKNFEYDEIKLLLKKALENKSLKREVTDLREQVASLTNADFIFGNTPEMEKVRHILTHIPSSQNYFYIQGETGTGKESLARQIHKMIFENKAEHTYHPFVRVNLASLNNNEIEKVLFGEEKETLVKEVHSQKGKFELAHGGMIYICEIDRAPDYIQSRILDVLKNQEIEKPGSEIPIHVDVKVVISSSKDLKYLVEQNLFNHDLYQLLSITHLHLPALKDRLIDIPFLVDMYFNRFAQKYNKKLKSLDAKIINYFKAYQWPGNIKELENIMERLISLTQNDTITEDDLPIDLKFLSLDQSDAPVEYNEILKLATAEFEKKFIISALNSNNWNQAQTAKRLGIHRKTLEYKIKKFHLQNIIDSQKKKSRKQNEYDI